MIDHMLYLALIVVTIVGMSNFLDNALGYPGKEFTNEIDTGAIFFGWTYQLAYMRVESLRGEKWMRELSDKVLAEFTEQADILQAVKDFKRAIVAEARPYFTWERAVGMCIYCTNFWISVLVCLFFGLVNPLESSLPFYFLIFTVPFLSHLILKHANSRAN